MITQIEGLPAGAVGFSAHGMVTREDYETIIMPAVAAVVEIGLEVRLLYRFGPEFEGFDGGAIWEDAVLGFRHPLEWDRIAVVSDQEWLGHAVRALRWLLPGRVRLYPDADLEIATAWISEPRADG